MGIARSKTIPKNRKNPHIPDQYDGAAGPDDLRFVQEPLAGRAILQVDQATPSDQGILRHLGERGDDAILDRRVVYVLVAILRKRLRLDASLYTLMQVFLVTVFEKYSMEPVILQTVDSSEPATDNNQLNLFRY
jgi:hypothetical protein